MWAKSGLDIGSKRYLLKLYFKRIVSAMNQHMSFLQITSRFQLCPWFPLSRFNADVDMDHQLGPRLLLSARTLNTLVVCPLYISAAYHHLHCFRLLLQSGAQPDFNYTGPVCQEALTRGLASCLLDAVLRHGCEVAFIHLLLDHGANSSLVPWDESELEAPNRRKVDPEALKVFLEAKSE